MKKENRFNLIKANIIKQFKDGYKQARTDKDFGGNGNGYEMMLNGEKAWSETKSPRIKKLYDVALTRRSIENDLLGIHNKGGDIHQILRNTLYTIVNLNQIR